MKSITSDQVNELALSNGLETLTTTESNSSYPQGLSSRHIVGFDNFDQVSEFVSQHGGTITMYHRKMGWHFWHAKGNAHKPFTYEDYLNDLGDDYSYTSLNEDEEFRKEQLKELSDKLDFEGIKRKIEEYEELDNELLNCPDGKIVITYLNSYSDTIDKEMMRYTEDNNQWVIGVDMREVTVDDTEDNDEEN